LGGQGGRTNKCGQDEHFGFHVAIQFCFAFMEGGLIDTGI
jgi:hypothetical protein